VFDGSASVLWDNLSWTAELPAGTAVQVEVRTGNSATPNATWSPYQTVSSPGAGIGVRARYLQYRVTLTTSSTAQTPVLQDVTVQYAA
jgi:hypothetical protein